MKVILAEPPGFCAGVERALEHSGPPVYVRRQIVHNAHLVASLEGQAAVFVDEVDEISPGAVTIFSSHDVRRRVETAAGASMPEFLVAEPVRRLGRLGYDQIETLAGVREAVSFKLPEASGGDQVTQHRRQPWPSH